MKYLALIFTLITTIGTFSALSAPPDTIDYFPNYRVQGGTPTFQNAVRELSSYPQNAQNRGIMGTSLAYLTLTPRGTIADVEVIISLGEAFDQELKRVVPLTEKYWLPDSVEQRNLVFMVAFTFLIDGFYFMRSSSGDQIAACEVFIVGYGGTNADIHSNDFYTKRANRFYQQKRYRRAINDLNELIRRDPFNRELYLMRGFSHFQLRNAAAACRDFQCIETLLDQPIPTAAKVLCQ